MQVKSHARISRHRHTRQLGNCLHIYYRTKLGPSTNQCNFVRFGLPTILRERRLPPGRSIWRRINSEKYPSCKAPGRVTSASCRKNRFDVELISGGELFYVLRHYAGIIKRGLRKKKSRTSFHCPFITLYRTHLEFVGALSTVMLSLAT